MNNTIEQIVKKIMALFIELDMKEVPLEIVIGKLSISHDMKQIEQAIELAQKQFKIDKVLDYVSNDWDLYSGAPIWHLSIPTPEKVTILRNLKPVDLALLQILKTQNIPKRLGTMKSDDIRVILQKQGFSKEETKFLWVEDMIDHHYDFEDGQSIEWCRLIPEDEKTEEYKKEQERIEAEFAKKEARRMFYADVCDLESSILKVVRESPDGISKKDIVKQLFTQDPDYVETAFRFVTEEEVNEIIPVVLENGEDGYRINPEYYKEPE